MLRLEQTPDLGPERVLNAFLKAAENAVATDLAQLPQ